MGTTCTHDATLPLRRIGRRRPVRGGRSVGSTVRRAAACGVALSITSGLVSIGMADGAGAATTVTPGVTANSITVGSISDISSPIAGLFEGAKVGTEAYFAYINSKGGVNGRKLILNGMDSAFSSGTVANEAKSIASNDFAIVGGFSLLDGAE
ncbi:MAG TPA: ABC transporter substrate-binding protein, partial [Acidimicrobiales bacterium]